MSKLSFRARALDASKPMPIYMAEELPDLPEYSAINRAVPQMPSGMEKEEECEHHLQRAICTGLIIPTPEVFDMVDSEFYDVAYPSNYKMPRQLIHMQPFLMEQDVPEYDMDSEDERWVNEQAKKMELTPLKFEEMMDRLEKGSGQTVVTLQEAKTLLKEDDDLTIAVYDYWLNKRLKMQHPLIPQVKTETRVGPGTAGGGTNNPYLAFRRRTEKMQTRKNRKNDETSYEKMLKLRRDLSRAITLLELVKRREKYKREHLHLTIEIYEKRYQSGDYSGQVLAELAALKPARPAFAQLQYQYNHNWVHKTPAPKEEVAARREKRQYKKRKHRAGGPATSAAGSRGNSLLEATAAASSEDEGAAHSGGSPSEIEEDLETEGPFAFRRKKSCNYQAALACGKGNWPWCSEEEGGLADKRYRYCLTTLNRPERHCVGFARRRLGRGGRVILDRASTSLDDYWSSLDFTVLEAGVPPQSSDAPSTSTTPPPPSAVSPPRCPPSPSDADFLQDLTADWPHFRPKSPASGVSDDSLEPLLLAEDSLELDVEGLGNENDLVSWSDSVPSSVLADTPSSWHLLDPALTECLSFSALPSSRFTVLDSSVCTHPTLQSTPSTSSATPSSAKPLTLVEPVIPTPPIASRLALKDRVNQIHTHTQNGPHLADSPRRSQAPNLPHSNSSHLGSNIRTIAPPSSTTTSLAAWPSEPPPASTRLTRPAVPPPQTQIVSRETEVSANGTTVKDPSRDDQSVDALLRHIMEVT